MDLKKKNRLKEYFSKISQAIIRSRLLRENGRFLPREAFVMRKHYFINEESGFFVKEQRQATPKMPMNGLIFILHYFYK